VSVPGSVALPRCVRRVDLPLPNGPLAALEALPQSTAEATALLVPGFTGSKEDFLALLEPFADAAVRVIAIDQRGQYQSPGLADPAGYIAAADQFGTSAFAADIRALVRSLADEGSGPVHLLGHSFGGHTVREALLGAGPRNPLPLASVTFLDSGPAAVVGRPSRERLELLLSVENQLTLQQIHDLSPVNAHPDARVSAFLLERWRHNDPASIFAMARRLLAEPDRTPELKALLDAWNLRCLIATGIDEDVWSARLLEEVAAQLEARYAVIPGAGHSPNTQQPEALAKALLEFWLS